jgi:hypothetical protein
MVARPELADLVPEFANEPTLYGRELTFEVSVDGMVVVSERWNEQIYDEESNRTRHEIQRQIWRVGRGTGTEADHRAAAIRDMRHRQTSRSE